MIYEFDGIKNVRDLGGYKTIDNTKVKYGFLIRGVGTFPIRSEKDIDLFLSFNLKTIIDLRSKEEAYDAPDFNIPNVKNYLIPGMCLEDGEEINFSTDGIKRILKKAKENNIKFENDDWFYHYYRKMFYNKKVFSKLFDILLQKKTPLYIHCTAGKDRTGIVAIVLLLALGVSREDAIKDYELTNECYRDIIDEKLNDRAEEIELNPSIKDEIIMTYGVDSSIVKKELDNIYEKYYSFEKFLMDYHGLTLNHILRLRAMYCE